MTRVRIATFDLDDLDHGLGVGPLLQERMTMTQSDLERLDADILCLQGVHGSAVPATLRELVRGTCYERSSIVSTIGPMRTNEDPRNMAILSRFDIVDRYQYDRPPAPAVSGMAETSSSAQPISAAGAIPILHVKTKVGHNFVHIVTVDLGSGSSTAVRGRRAGYEGESAGGQAKDALISSRERIGQAHKLRRFIDAQVDRDAYSIIVVGGYFDPRSEAVEMAAFRGEVGSTRTNERINRTMVPSEHLVDLYHHVIGRKLDFFLLSWNLLEHYTGTEIHNALWHDRSIFGATDAMHPVDNTPIVAGFELP